IIQNNLPAKVIEYNNSIEINERNKIME
ncbi:MAG: hypothetical protein RL728_393, partial [Bacteroidota bacterium]